MPSSPSTACSRSNVLALHSITYTRPPTQALDLHRMFTSPSTACSPLPPLHALASPHSNVLSLHCTFSFPSTACLRKPSLECPRPPLHVHPSLHRMPRKSSLECPCPPLYVLLSLHRMPSQALTRMTSPSTACSPLAPPHALDCKPSHEFPRPPLHVAFHRMTSTASPDSTSLALLCM